MGRRDGFGPAKHLQVNPTASALTRGMVRVRSRLAVGGARHGATVRLPAALPPGGLSERDRRRTPPPHGRSHRR
jgi:hypothetical protein